MSYYRSNTNDLWWTKASKEHDKVTVFLWQNNEWTFRGYYSKQAIKNATKERTLKHISRLEANRTTLKIDYKKYSLVRRVMKIMGETK